MNEFCVQVLNKKKIMSRILANTWFFLFYFILFSWEPLTEKGWNNDLDLGTKN